ncbi:CoA-binding protein [Zopfochytrium polystomum]|nr:CoA-binding protein [Zopfochytrium polystomum]
MNATSSFFQSQRFAVAGASADVSKFGYKVLRWYADRGLDVTPINPKTPAIDGITCTTSLRSLPEPTRTSLSVVTPPAVTLNVLKEAKELGIPAVWLQPGAENQAVMEWIGNEASAESGMTVIAGGPCVLVLGDAAIRDAKAATGRL